MVIVKRNFKRGGYIRVGVYIYLKFNISGEMVRDGYQGFIYSKFETLKT